MIVIFAHGFGLLKDQRGLFTAIEEHCGSLAKDWVYTSLSRQDLETNEVHTLPFSAQATLLGEELSKAKKKYPSEKLFLISHSQGGYVASMCSQGFVDVAICAAPFFEIDREKIAKKYFKDSGSVLNFEGVSRRCRTDGSVTVIPKEYWDERVSAKQIDQFTNFAKHTNLHLILGNDDPTSHLYRSEEMKGATIHTLDGGHDFLPPHREKYIALVHKLLQEV